MSIDGKRYYIATESDRNELVAMQKELDTLKRNMRTHHDIPPLAIDSNTYIAKTPSGGIPALTGTTPGEAECYIYNLEPDPDDPDLKKIILVDTFFQVVYNISTEAIPANTYIEINLDRYGAWLASSIIGTEAGSGSGSGTAAYEDEGSLGYCRLAKLKPTDCIEATITNGGDSTTLVYDAGHWVSSSSIEYLDTSGQLEFWFENGALHLSLDDLELLNCGNGCFTGGPLTGHQRAGSGSGSGSSGDTACTGETFTICLVCTCCPVEGWDGEGWYCVNLEGSGSNPSDCEPIYLTDEDKCLDLTICSGPYDSEAEANIECGAPLVWPCTARPHVTVAAFINRTLDCVCLPSTPTILGTGPVNPTTIGTSSCPGNIVITITCTGGFIASSGTAGVTVTLTSASPTQLTFHVTGYGANCGMAGGTADLVLTGTFN